MFITLIIINILSLTFIFFYSLIQLSLVFNYFKHHKKKHILENDISELKEFPFVTVQLPVFNELYVIERLIDKVAGFDYPRDKFEIQILDDSTDETVEISKKKVGEWRSKGINIELITRDDRAGFKAGALQEGMKSCRGEYIAIFDADFLPPEDFLKKTIGYFLYNDKIGAVQTKWGHINRDYSLLTRIQGFALDAHFTIEQQGRNSGGYCINFNGTAGVWRKKCIEDSGGWQADTLTEDLDLSYRAQMAGWKFKYIEDFTSPAELPILMSAVKSQQFRWTKGGAETGKKHVLNIWRSNFTLGQKVHGTVHLISSWIFIFVLLSSLLSVPMLIVKNSSPEFSKYFYLMSVFVISLMILAVFYYSSMYRRYKNKTIALFHFSYLFPIFLSFSMGLALHNTVAVLEGLLGFKSQFIRTPKFNILGNKRSSKANKYIKRKISFITILEFVLSMYFLGGLIMAFHFKDFALFPFHLMLMTGFGMVFLYTFKRTA